jgi:hypothetical protein
MADSTTTESLKQLILAGMAEAPHFLEIVDESGGCGSKFKVIVVSDSFQGVVSHLFPLKLKREVERELTFMNRVYWTGNGG